MKWKVLSTEVIYIGQCIHKQVSPKAGSFECLPYNDEVSIKNQTA
jgi:hypothetical protein